MSRSRRKRKLGKCICGRGHIPLIGVHRREHGRTWVGCPILEFVHEMNDEFLHFKEMRERLRYGVSIANDDTRLA